MFIEFRPQTMIAERAPDPRLRIDPKALDLQETDRDFFRRPTVRVARDLLGAWIARRWRERWHGARIVETEAYLGPEDAASHAAFRPGSRELFYGPGGFAYVYRIYGVHDCLNAIAGRTGQPGCVLIRALEPLDGAAAMACRRGVAATSPRLATGPGNLARALGVSRRHNGIDLTVGPLTIAPRQIRRGAPLAAGPRVGITRDAARVLRFWIAGSPHVSRAR
jgi:DNA-3-methyladenine glycosylase